MATYGFVGTADIADLGLLMWGGLYLSFVCDCICLCICFCIRFHFDQVATYGFVGTADMGIINVGWVGGRAAGAPWGLHR